jgi:agmatine/peptidylarginine deiminase
MMIMTMQLAHTNWKEQLGDVTTLFIVSAALTIARFTNVIMSLNINNFDTAQIMKFVWN